MVKEISMRSGKECFSLAKTCWDEDKGVVVGRFVDE